MRKNFCLLSEETIRESIDKGINAGQIGKIYGFGKTTILSRAKKFGINFQKFKIESVSGENNHKWTGDKVGKKGVHGWIRKYKPKPRLCERCNKIPTKEISNNSGKYLRDINDYEWLCIKCHRRKDAKNTVWNKDEINILYEKYPIINTIELAKLLNKDYSCVRNKIKRLKIKKIKISCPNCNKNLITSVRKICKECYMKEYYNENEDMLKKKMSERYHKNKSNQSLIKANATYKKIKEESKQ